MSLKLLFLTPYPINESPSQRFRFEQYFFLLRQQGHFYEVKPFLNAQNWRLFFKEGNFFLKLNALLRGYFNRFLMLFNASKYDFIFIHREASPAGPPLFEWFIGKILNIKIIYDFDDAIWSTDRNKESIILRLFKWRSKVAWICRWSYKVSCGNHYLCRYALQFNSKAVYNPTTVDTDFLHNPDLFPAFKNRGQITIGWTGSHSTLKYLNAIESVLKRLENEYNNISIVIIADKKPNLTLEKLQFVPWNMQREVEDLLLFDIGLMPLFDDEWSKGKCGFKILQYLSLRIPAVASPVGVNSELIQHNRTGYLCKSADSWYVALKTLIEDKMLRNSFGDNGRQFVKSHYSTSSNASNFLSLFE